MTTTTPFRELIESDGSLPEPSGYGAKPADEISLLDMLLVVAKHKRMVLLVSAAFAIIAAIVSLILPKRYTATVVMLPPQQTSSVGAALASQLGSMGGLAALAGGSFGFKNPNEMYIAMLKSHAVESAMVQHFGLMREYHKRYESDARKSLEAHSVVTGNSKDGLIHISVWDLDPRRAADLANGYVDQFRSLSQHLAITEASQRRLFFEQELVHAKDNLATAELALQQTMQTSGVIELDSQARALIQSGATLRAQITAREVQIQGMETYATGENAQLVQAQRELESLRAQLNALGGSADSSAGEIIVPKGKITGAGLDYVRKLRDVKYNEAIFEILLKQFELAKLDEAKQGSIVQVVDPAFPPDKRSFPKRGLIVLLAAALGFFAGVLASFVVSEFERIPEDSETAHKLNLLRNFLSFKH
ncbi:MAG: Wzz/FepE/Etk N-terminal domain-containing protein [Terracidiphilus sp.]|jgi:uncharacterized protein involved in exopolysaccharide biosynthesis